MRQVQIGDTADGLDLISIVSYMQKVIVMEGIRKKRNRQVRSGGDQQAVAAYPPAAAATSRQGLCTARRGFLGSRNQIKKEWA